MTKKRQKELESIYSNLNKEREYLITWLQNHPNDINASLMRERITEIDQKKEAIYNENVNATKENV